MPKNTPLVWLLLCYQRHARCLMLELTFMMQWLVERMGGLLVCLMWFGRQLLQESRTWNWYPGSFSQSSAFLYTWVIASMSGTCDQTGLSWKAVLETHALWLESLIQASVCSWLVLVWIIIFHCILFTGCSFSLLFAQCTFLGSTCSFQRSGFSNLLS